MDSDLWTIISKKKHKLREYGHKEYEDFPVIYSPFYSKAVPKKLYKIDKDLKIKEVGEKDNFNKKIRTVDDKILVARSINLGYYLIIPLLFGLFFGYWLDNLFSSKPIFLLIFFSLGVVASFYNL